MSLSLRNLFGGFTTRTTTKTSARRGERSRPQLEGLEDRLVQSTQLLAAAALPGSSFIGPVAASAIKSIEPAAATATELTLELFPRSGGAGLTLVLDSVVVGGAGSGARDGLTATVPINSVFSELSKDIANGTEFKSAVLVEKDAATTVTLTLSDVIVAGESVSSSSGSAPTESVKFVYASSTESYTT
jgi:hypothetical protein